MPKKTQDGRPRSAAIVEVVSDESLPAMPRLNVLRQTPTPEALRLIPESLARKCNAVPLGVEDGTLRVAMANPGDVLAIEALAARTKKRIEPVPAEPVDIKEAIDFNYRQLLLIPTESVQIARNSLVAYPAWNADTECKL